MEYKPSWEEDEWKMELSEGRLLTKTYDAEK